MRLFLVAFGCLAAIGCSDFNSTDREAASGSSGTSSGDGSGDGAAKTPEDNAKGGTPVGASPLAGVFVSASRGSDTGSGTMDSPLLSLASAIALAQNKNLPVNACAETYAESLTAVDGVSLYGYFDCGVSPWVRGTKHAQIVSPTSPAITAHAITKATRIEGFDAIAPDLDAAPATDADGSSIGLDARDANALTISEAIIHAGRAAGGMDGTEAPVNSGTIAMYAAASRNQQTGLCANGVDCASQVVPGPQGSSAMSCAMGPAGGPGGQGGDPLFIANGRASTGIRDYHGKPLAATADTAAGDSDGAAGKEGTDGPNGAWRFTGGVFVRGNGTAGGVGGPGQGGGGGYSANSWFDANGNISAYPSTGTYWVTARGGGGGAGGCAGQVGTPGTGGAASIGALVVSSVVTFENVTIESSLGGRAGKGALGSLGTAGQATPSPSQFINGVMVSGRGGSGGNGGNGGGSGHGAAGPSIALAYSGARPRLTSTQLMPGAAGAGQPELRQSSPVGDKVVPAATGVSEAEHQIQ